MVQTVAVDVNVVPTPSGVTMSSAVSVLLDIREQRVKLTSMNVTRTTFVVTSTKCVQTLSDRMHVLAELDSDLMDPELVLVCTI